MKSVSRRMSATAIILLALWGGGVACLWCCASDLPTMMNQRSAGTVSHANPSCSSRRPCCKATESDQRAAIKEASSPAAAHCCPIGARTSGPAVFPTSQQRQVLAVTIIEPSAPVAITRRAPLLISDAPPANKGSTYLRCCVFLI